MINEDMIFEEVALRKESVDRNMLNIGTLRSTHVALRKESVDRNGFPVVGRPEGCRSLSARRAWIEITSEVSERVPLAGRSPQGERG